MPEFRNKRVLIVEDETELADALALRLASGWGFVVAVAHDGAEGLRKASAFKPDIILMDIAMPEVDGWEMCRRLRDDPDTRHIELIIMTAWDAEGLRARAAEEGAAKVLMKPFEDEELLHILRAYAGTGGRKAL